MTAPTDTTLHKADAPVAWQILKDEVPLNYFEDNDRGILLEGYTRRPLYLRTCRERTPAQPVRPAPDADVVEALRERPLEDFAVEAADIADSPSVLGVYAAPEFGELGEDGQKWACAIVRETRTRFATPAAEALRLARAHLVSWHGEPDEESSEVHTAVVQQIDTALALLKAFDGRFLQDSHSQTTLRNMADAFDHMLFNVPGDREYAARREFDRLLSSARLEARPAPSTDLWEACKPWEFHLGPPPPDDSPLSAVFGAGMAYTENLLAKLLGVDKYEGGDGSENFDQDATKTLENILVAAKLYDPGEGQWALLPPVQPAPSTRMGTDLRGSISRTACAIIARQIKPGPHNTGKMLDGSLVATGDEIADAILPIIAEMKARCDEAEHDVGGWKARSEAWKRAARQAGVCMNCAIAFDAPCTDCLGAGWNEGAPNGFVRADLYSAEEARADALAGEVERLQQLVCEHRDRADNNEAALATMRKENERLRAKVSRDPMCPQCAADEGDYFRRTINEAVAAEREACEQIAEEYSFNLDSADGRAASSWINGAIRARAALPATEGGE